MSTNEIRPKVDLDAYRHSVNILQFIEGERAKISQRLAELKEVEEEALAVVQEALGNHGEVGLLDGKPVVTWHKTYQRRVNQRLLKERYPEIAEEVKSEIEIRSFKVVL